MGAQPEAGPEHQTRPHHKQTRASEQTRLKQTKPDQSRQTRASDQTTPQADQSRRADQADQTRPDQADQSIRPKSGCRVHGLSHGPVVCDAGMLPVGSQTMLETVLVDLTTLLLVGPRQLFEADGFLL